MTTNDTRVAPQATREGVRQAYTFDALQDMLKRLHATESLRAISKKLYDGRVSHGTVDRCIKGIEPKDAEIREIMGLPQIVQQKVFRDPITGRFIGANDVAS